MRTARPNKGRGEKLPLSLTSFLLCSRTQSSRLAEGVSGDEPAAEAGAAPAGGLVTRTRATTATKGSMDSEPPQWSAARRVPRSQGARGRLASVLERAAQAPQVRPSHGRTGPSLAPRSPRCSETQSKG